MKVSVKKLYDLGIDTVEIHPKESYKISQEVLNNAISDILISDFSDSDLSEFESLLILIIMGYFDKFKDYLKEAYGDEGWINIKEIHTTDKFNDHYNDLIRRFTFEAEEVLRTVSTIYDFNKKLILDEYGVAISNKIDVVSKELLARKLTDDLINLANDYYRTFGQKINSNINLTHDDLLDNIDKLKNDTPLVNRDGKSTKNLADRVRDIARTTQTLIKAQATLNTGLQLGLSEYNILTRKDSRVCQDCRYIESNNPYNINSGIFPPFHNLCRCIIEFLQDTISNTIEIDEFFDISSKSWIQV